jgi:hypothetical protein
MGFYYCHLHVVYVLILIFLSLSLDAFHAAADVRNGKNNLKRVLGKYNLTAAMSEKLKGT